MKKIYRNLFFITIYCCLLISCSVNSKQEGNEIIKGRFYSDGSPVSISIDKGKIVSVNKLSTNAKVPEYYIAPGLIDIQINGFMGVDFSEEGLTPEDFRKTTKSLWAVGVTSFIPTVVSNTPERINSAFQRLSVLAIDKELKESVPGFHLEGPYISPEPGYRGAHLEKYIKSPDWEEFNGFMQASQNMIKIITVAPETEGAESFIGKCIQKGLVVSLGHHNGNTEEINRAVKAGATMSTHLGNGCANMINRHHNPIWPQLANDSLSAGIIVDGFHLTNEEVRTFYKVKGKDRTILVSDAIDLAGLPPGEYTRREKRLVLTPENVVKFPAEDVLAGAATPLSICVNNMLKFTNCSLADAIQMASSNPAKLLGLNDRGEIEVGRRADLILFSIVDGKLVVDKTIVKGDLVFSKD